MARDIRQLALERIAALSAATSTSTSFDRSDLDKLCRACLVVKREPGSGDSHAIKQPGRIPMVGSGSGGGEAVYYQADHFGLDYSRIRRLVSSV